MDDEMWGSYCFKVLTIDELCGYSGGGIYIYATELEQVDGRVLWTACFVGETEDFDKLEPENDEYWEEAQEIGGATHIHILEVSQDERRKFYLQSILSGFGFGSAPFINQRIQTGNASALNPSLVFLPSSVFGETNSKLELLYRYEKHYLELIKGYKEEIKFANALQEDLRRERSQFFTQTLKDVIQTMKSAEIEKNVSAQWIQDLVASYTKSIDLSGDLAKTHVIEILSILTEETKKEASKAKLDDLNSEEKPRI